MKQDILNQIDSVVKESDTLSLKVRVDRLLESAAPAYIGYIPSAHDTWVSTVIVETRDVYDYRDGYSGCCNCIFDENTDCSILDSSIEPYPFIMFPLHYINSMLSSDISNNRDAAQYQEKLEIVYRTSEEDIYREMVLHD